MFVTVWSTSWYACLKNDCFISWQTTDPYELHNIYDTAPASVKTALAEKLRKYYPCKGVECP